MRFVDAECESSGGIEFGAEGGVRNEAGLGGKLAAFSKCAT